MLALGAISSFIVAGDGPGQSQGIIQASVAGLLAGAGLAAALVITGRSGAR